MNVISLWEIYLQLPLPIMTPLKFPVGRLDRKRTE